MGVGASLSLILLMGPISSYQVASSSLDIKICA